MGFIEGGSPFNIPGKSISITRERSAVWSDFEAWRELLEDQENNSLALAGLGYEIFARTYEIAHAETLIDRLRSSFRGSNLSPEERYQQRKSTVELISLTPESINKPRNTRAYSSGLFNSRQIENPSVKNALENLRIGISPTAFAEVFSLFNPELARPTGYYFIPGARLYQAMCQKFLWLIKELNFKNNPTDLWHVVLQSATQLQEDRIWDAVTDRVRNFRHFHITYTAPEKAIESLERDGRIILNSMGYLEALHSAEKRLFDGMTGEAQARYKALGLVTFAKKTTLELEDFKAIFSLTTLLLRAGEDKKALSEAEYLVANFPEVFPKWQVREIVGLSVDDVERYISSAQQARSAKCKREEFLLAKKDDLIKNIQKFIGQKVRTLVRQYYYTIIGTTEDAVIATVESTPGRTRRVLIALDTFIRLYYPVFENNSNS